MDFSDLDATGKTYITFLSDVPVSTEENCLQIKRLIQMILGAHATNIFRFGRSGCAALVFAIQLKQFCNYLPPVWWVGDQVRQAIREKDVVILFSGSGKRPEVNNVAEKIQISSI